MTNFSKNLIVRSEKVKQILSTPSDPRELCSEGEIIVVTVQYRLGSFGFLFLDDPSVPGNVGIMDQKMGKRS